MHLQPYNNAKINFDEAADEVAGKSRQEKEGK